MINRSEAMAPTGGASVLPGAALSDVANTVWIMGGRVVERPLDRDGKAVAENLLFQRHGCVKVASGREGTEVTWATFAGNWASLYAAMEFVAVTPGPWRLRYFLAGWFTEDFEDLAEARARIGVVLGKCDIHLQRRTYVMDVKPEGARMPDLLRKALDNELADPAMTVDVAQDPYSKNFQVGRIGSSSLIAKYYGLNPVSYPCQSFHSYHHVVSRAYEKVMKSREPHYDHVLAAFQAPDASIRWFGYQRVVLPARFPDGSRGVSVVSAEAKVDIRLI